MRDGIIEFVRKELIGPDPCPPHIQENGEEILVNESPRLRYGAGILFPQNSSTNKTESLDETEQEIIENSDDNLDNDINASDESDKPLRDDSDSADEEITLANNFLPSAMGITCFCNIPNDGFEIAIQAARYFVKDYSFTRESGQEIHKKAHFRESLDCTIKLSKNDIPHSPGESKSFAVQDSSENETGLFLHIRNRSIAQKDGQLLTFSLINEMLTEGGSIHNESCFFQVTFSVKASKEEIFLPYPEADIFVEHEDERATRLLYRDKKSYAVGHGCAASWDTSGKVIYEIRAEVLPVYDIKPILPSMLDGVSLRMDELSDLSETDSTIELEKMCDQYEKWIDKLEEKAKLEFSLELLETAEAHISDCKKALKRMKQGIDLLKGDSEVLRAFQLMNRAMLLQQLHFKMPTRNWRQSDLGITPEESDIPDIGDPTSWQPNVGSWRPFQLAFILMNIESFADPFGSDREIVDLIWFPTGGGKTEAYLGLTAYCVFLRRIRNSDDFGTTVLMRYTLRLLTAQQFQRAASLICACEYMRRQSEEELGKNEISIGLWVGEGLTPNKRVGAVGSFNELLKGTSNENPFIVLKCPWCGTKMGPVKVSGSTRVKGYFHSKTPSSILFKCDNNDCDFSDDHGLPLKVIDEDIYENPPTLLIGTVDKFAMLPWLPGARTIFGFSGEQRITPPELIIQDELHLISGPLGSMVGLYETMIQELCTDHSSGRKPKIVASTATISRAREQIRSLYNTPKENVSVFPPQGLDYGNSFFAYEDKTKKGRTYVGIYGSALPSHATAQIKIISALLQSVKSIETTGESDKNGYWTILNYFNSIRELGHAATLLRADIREYMNSMWSRKGIRKTEQKDFRRFINKDIELTSRINNTEIPQYLEDLEINYPSEDKRPVDICLATSMISVGVDVPRLGLMTVIGQPKTTSEYIQATSRVGRSSEFPGLVITIYNAGKPRDRSHYENFISYHSKIYSHVEPTSVTPFSSPVRERALHAVVVGLIRVLSDKYRYSPTPFPNEELLKEIEKIILERVSHIDSEERNRTSELFKYFLDEWKRLMPPVYGGFTQSEETPLIYPAGSNPTGDVKERSWATPTSMRNVDSACEGMIIPRYVSADDA